MGQNLFCREYNLGTVSATKKLSEIAITRKDNTITPAGNSAPVDIRRYRSVMLHIVVSNASTLNADFTAYMLGILPSETTTTVAGVKFDGGTSDINFTANGEYILDITDTAAAAIDPAIEINAGSADIVLFVTAKV